jgi:hypothetical protein
MTQPDIYTVEARRWVGAGYRASGMNCTAELIESGGQDDDFFVASYAATLRELNWQPPVDPDLVEARKIAAAHWQHSDPRYASEILSGTCDSGISVSVAIPAIKRGRELEATERGA